VEALTKGRVWLRRRLYVVDKVWEVGTEVKKKGGGLVNAPFRRAGVGKSAEMTVEGSVVLDRVEKLYQGQRRNGEVRDRTNSEGISAGADNVSRTATLGAHLEKNWAWAGHGGGRLAFLRRSHGVEIQALPNGLRKTLRIADLTRIEALNNHQNLRPSGSLQLWLCKFPRLRRIMMSF
jgi:hypothetical protein